MDLLAETSMQIYCVPPTAVVCIVVLNVGELGYAFTRDGNLIVQLANYLADDFGSEYKMDHFDLSLNACNNMLSGRFKDLNSSNFSTNTHKYRDDE